MIPARRLVAGLDIGNATTELVVAGPGDGPELEPLWHGQVPTAGRKGSPASVRAAAQLLAQAERELGGRCDLIGLAELRPVDTEVRATHRPPATAAVVNAVRPGASTPAGEGYAAGWHARLADLQSSRADQDLVVSVPPDVDFADAARIIAAAMEAGSRIVGVVVDADDGVLVSNRLPRSVPVVDEVDTSTLPPGGRLAVEVVAGTSARRVLADPLAVTAALGLPPDRHRDIAAATREFADAPALALYAPAPAGGGAVEPPGTPEMLGADAESALDVFTVDLSTVDDGIWLRRGLAHLDATLWSVLAAPLAAQAAPLLVELTGRPVEVVATEHDAAALGSASTPGLPVGAAVCDIGGGTIDLVWEGQSVVAAGAGALITLAVATALDVPPALAERVKRTAAVHVQTPHLIHEEDGRRSFLTVAAPAAAIGRLCHRQDTELLPFSDQLAAEEWRSLRLALKRATVGANIARSLARRPERPSVLVLAGGGALDDELVRTVSESLRGTTTVGRANVAGRFGPRYAVAWGLAQLAHEQLTRSEESKA